MSSTCSSFAMFNYRLLMIRCETVKLQKNNVSGECTATIDSWSSLVIYAGHRDPPRDRAKMDINCSRNRAMIHLISDVDSGWASEYWLGSSFAFRRFSVCIRRNHPEAFSLRVILPSILRQKLLD